MLVDHQQIFWITEVKKRDISMHFLILTTSYTKKKINLQE